MLIDYYFELFFVMVDLIGVQRQHGFLYIALPFKRIPRKNRLLACYCYENNEPTQK
jgi:hypothetical protein